MDFSTPFSHLYVTCFPNKPCYLVKTQICLSLQGLDEGAFDTRKSSKITRSLWTDLKDFISWSYCVQNCTHICKAMPWHCLCHSTFSTSIQHFQTSNSHNFSSFQLPSRMNYEAFFPSHENSYKFSNVFFRIHSWLPTFLFFCHLFGYGYADHLAFWWENINLK